MIMKSIFLLRVYLVVTLIALTWLVSCQPDAEPTPAIAPNALVYSPNTLQLAQGTAGNSVAPTIQGTAPFTYSVASNPTQSGITINAQGAIQIANTVPVGTYTLGVTANNEAGSSTFANAYTVTINAQVLPPSALAYSPNNLTTIEGIVANSATPTISGTAPFTYNVTASPATGGITINSQGVINVANVTVKGTYVLNVSAMNSAGTVNFPNIYTVIVNQANTAPANLTYSPSALNLLQGGAGNSSTPTVQGTQPISFAIVSVTPSNAAITMNAQGAIQVGTSSVAGVFTVNVSATNSVNTTNFNNAFVVTVRAPITFNANIQPLIASKCGSCHIPSGSQTNYTDYNNSKISIDTILDRVNRAVGTSGAMPQGGPQLSLAERALLLQWKNDGLKQ